VTTRLIWVATAVSTVALLAACTNAGPTGPQVAALPTTITGRTSVPTTATSVVAGRPQERLDDTEQQHDAMIAAWDACLATHGATYTTSQRAAAGGRPRIAEPIPSAAAKACLYKEPLGPPQLDPNLNPHYRDDMTADVNCLRAHGEMVHLTQDTSAGPNGLAWTFDNNTPPLPANSAQLENQCQLAAFSGK
jgi:hypothetical protein